MYDTILAHLSRFITLEPAEADYLPSLLKYKLLRKRQCLVQAGNAYATDSV